MRRMFAALLPLLAAAVCLGSDSPVAGDGGFAVTAAGRAWRSLGGRLPRGFTTRTEWRDGELLCTLAAAADATLPEGGVAWPPPFAAESGAERFLLMQGSGMAFRADMLDLGTDSIDFSRYGGRNMSMGCFAHYTERTNPDGSVGFGPGYLAILETPHDAGTEFTVRTNGLRQAGFRHLPTRGRFGYDRRMRFVFFEEASPMKMALRYREEVKRRGLYRTFAEKAAADPRLGERLARFAGAPDVWYWSENPDKAAMAARLRGLGFGNFLMQFATRHDLGVWVEPGEVADAARKVPALYGEYDIYRDFMDPANLPLIDCVRPHWPKGVWENDDYILKADGTPLRGWRVNRRGTTDERNRIGCCLLCEARAWKYAREKLARIHSQAPYDARLFDVMGTGVGECYNPKHPLDRRRSAEARRGFFAAAGKEFGILVGTEDGSELIAPVCSYFEGMMSAPQHYRVDGGRYMWKLYDDVPDKVRRGMDVTVRVPFWQMVFHASVVTYWYWCDYNTKFPKLRRTKDLVNIVTGEPAMYLFTDESFERMQTDLVASNRAVAPVAEAVFGEEMTDYRWLTADRLVQRSAFANGVTVTVNFGSRPFRTEDGAELAPMDFRMERK